SVSRWRHCVRHHLSHSRAAAGILARIRYDFYARGVGDGSAGVKSRVNAKLAFAAPVSGPRSANARANTRTTGVDIPGESDPVNVGLPDSVPGPNSLGGPNPKIAPPGPFKPPNAFAAIALLACGVDDAVNVSLKVELSGELTSKRTVKCDCAE